MSASLVPRPFAALAGALLCAAALSACGPEEPPARGLVETPFELRDVVRPALAAALAAAPRDAGTTPAPADPEAIEAALGGLASPEARIARLAEEDARALGDAAVAPLAGILRAADADPARRAAAAHALSAVRTQAALDVLLDVLEKEREPWLRAQCAWRIRAMELDTAVPRLLLRLKYEVDGSTVIWIADALAAAGHFAGIDGLRVVRDSNTDESVRAAAAERLAAIAGAHGFESGDALYAEWFAGDPADRLEARAPSPALVRDAWDWTSRLAEWDLRRVDDARFVLVRLEDFVVPMLAATLHDADVYTRVHAAQVLERRGVRSRAAVDELMAALADPRVGPQAALALGAIGHRPAAQRLTGILSGARDLERRIAAARALGGTGGPEDVALLRAATDAREPIDLRQAAAGSLVRLRHGDDQVAFLLECLASPAADAGAAEHALGAWIESRARAGDAPWKALAERWSALDPLPNSVPGADEVSARRKERAAIAREGLAALGR